MEPRWATVLAFSLGWCFLPIAGFSIPGIPDYNKTTATVLAAFLGLTLFHTRLLFRFRPHAFDLPVAVLCVTPFFSSISNDLGSYDGLSACITQVVFWGMPYAIGRIAFRSPADLVVICKCLIICGLIYVPFCLLEIRVSPQLHNWVYGFHQHEFAQTARGGGWRPMVFMQHGLQVAMWICCSLLVSLSEWRIATRNPAFRTNGYFRPGWAAIVLALTLLLLKSTGAMFLAAVGILNLWLIQRFRSYLPLLIIPLLIFIYLTLRISEFTSSAFLINTVRVVASEERVASLQFRFDNEEMLLTKALQRPFLGWGGWGRNRVYDESGKDISYTDGLWIIEIGAHGIVGLAGLYLFLLLPSIVCGGFRSYREEPLDRATKLRLGTLCVVTAICAIDTIPNAMQSSVFTMILGAITTSLLNTRRLSGPGYGVTS
jgi:hypothetical protein